MSTVMHRISLAILLALGLAANAPAALVHFWKLDEASGTTAANTQAPGSPGTYGRDASNTYTASGPGGSITKSQNFVAASSDSVGFSTVTFTDTQPFTYSAWVQFADNNEPIWGRSGSDVSRIERTAAATITVTNNAGTSQSFTTSSLSNGVWYNVVVTRNASNSVSVFINGVQQDTSKTIGGIMANFYAGRRNATYLDGAIAWLKIWNTDESANVAAMYAEGAGVAMLVDNVLFRSILLHSGLVR